MLGPKIDARLNQLERKLADLTHRLERLEKPAAVAASPALEAEVNLALGLPAQPKKRGRPPKAKE
jgi:hypothetical protein